MRRKRHQFTSTIAGRTVRVSYDADTMRNGRVFIEGLGRETSGDTWLEAIAKARRVIAAANTKKENARNAAA